MTAMAPAVIAIAVGFLCLALIPAVSAYCEAYRDGYGNYHNAQRCAQMQFCCGSCVQRACCADRRYYMSDNDQARCRHSSDQSGSIYTKAKKLSSILGAVLGSALPILLCVGLVICCCAPCCCLYKKCRNRKGRTQPVVTPNFFPGPQPNYPSGPQPNYPSGPQPNYPSGPQPNYPSGPDHFTPGPQFPGYFAEPPQPDSGTPLKPLEPDAEAPPAYGDPAVPDPAPNTVPYSNAGYTDGKPLYPLLAPDPPPNSDYLPQPPFNPAYS